MVLGFIKRFFVLDLGKFLIVVCLLNFSGVTGADASETTGVPKSFEIEEESGTFIATMATVVRAKPSDDAGAVRDVPIGGLFTVTGSVIGKPWWRVRGGSFVRKDHIALVDAAEFSIWNQIKDSRDNALFEDFLGRFSGTGYAALVKIYMKRNDAEADDRLGPKLGAFVVIPDLADLRIQPSPDAKIFTRLTTGSIIEVSGPVPGKPWLRMDSRVKDWHKLPPSLYIPERDVAYVDAAEISNWNQVKNSESNSEFEDFLRLHPKSGFRNLVKRLMALNTRPRISVGSGDTSIPGKTASFDGRYRMKFDCPYGGRLGWNSIQVTDNTISLHVENADLDGKFSPDGELELDGSYISDDGMNTTLWADGTMINGSLEGRGIIRLQYATGETLNCKFTMSAR